MSISADIDSIMFNAVCRHLLRRTSHSHFSSKVKGESDAESRAKMFKQIGRTFCEDMAALDVGDEIEEITPTEQQIHREIDKIENLQQRMTAALCELAALRIKITAEFTWLTQATDLASAEAPKQDDVASLSKYIEGIMNRLQSPHHTSAAIAPLSSSISPFRACTDPTSDAIMSM